MKWKKILKTNRQILLILLTATFLRFAGLNWGWPYQFHPDEWNMAHAITQLSWDNRLNPNFFAYGQFPLYLAYFSALIYNLVPWIHLSQIDIQEAVFFLRFWSAVAGVGSVYLVYLISRRLLSFSRFSLVAAFLAAFAPGLIQNSHFGTTESILTFCFLAIAYFSLRIIKEPTRRNYLWAAFFSALALATKITGLVFLLPPIAATGIHLFLSTARKEKLKVLSYELLSLIFTLVLTLTFSPYLWLNFPESRRILTYESLVAMGKIPVFYTRQFYHTLPGIFQMQKIFPFALGWPLFILGLTGFVLTLLAIAKALQKKQISNFEWSLLVLNLAFLTYFFSQAFLFTKWTRFMAPLFPFFTIFAALAIKNIGQKIRSSKLLFAYHLLLLTLLILPGLFFSTIYFRPDIRLTASEWIYQNIPSGAKVLSESGNVVDIPVSSPHSPMPNIYHLTPVSFDFYRLDENPETLSKLITQLTQADYLIVPSRRVFANHQRLPEKFPLTAKYYQLLFSGKLGFKLIKEFSPFNLSLVSYHFSFSDESAEETWSVFDHPVIRIYQKTERLTTKDYVELFQK